MNGLSYLEMLNERIIPELWIIYGERRNSVRCMQDGAPAHRTPAVKELLREVFGNRVIAKEDAIEWPSRSPDFTLCCFFL